MIEPKNKITKTDILGLLKHMFLLSLPIFSILSTHLLQSIGNNTLIMIMILVIAIFPIIIVINYFEEKLYLLAIVSISLSLLYLTSSNYSYLWGTDLHKEFYYASIVKNEGHWNSQIPHKFNAMLSIVLLAPAYSIISGMPLMTVFKIIYPILYSTVPLMLYIMFKEQFDHKIAFFGSFFFISIFTFYTEMLGLARQQIGEIIFVLVIYLITTKTIYKNKKILIYTFLVILSLSHYVLSYIFIIFSIMTLIISYIQEKVNIQTLKQKFTNTYVQPNITTIKNKNITILITLFSLIMTMSWYIYNSSSVIFRISANLFEQIINAIIFELFDIESTQALYILLSGQKTILHDITKILHITMQILITIGFVKVTINKIRDKLSYDFVMLSASGYLIAFATIIVPFLSSAINTTRMYHIALIFLAPYSVIGFNHLFTRIFSQKNTLQIFSIFLSIFLLFNTGFMYEIKAIDKSIANPYWALSNGSSRDRLVLYNSYTPVEEIESAKWLSLYRESNDVVYSDTDRSLNAYALLPPEEISELWKYNNNLESNYYVYLRKLNIYDGLITGWTTPQGIKTFNSTETIPGLIKDLNLIYSNGGSLIFKSTDYS